MAEIGADQCFCVAIADLFGSDTIAIAAGNFGDVSFFTGRGGEQGAIDHLIGALAFEFVFACICGGGGRAKGCE